MFRPVFGRGDAAAERLHHRFRRQIFERVGTKGTELPRGAHRGGGRLRINCVRIFDVSNSYTHDGSIFAGMSFVFEQRQFIIEFDLHAHRYTDCHEMSLVGEQQRASVGRHKPLLGRIDERKVQLAFEDAHDAPHAGFGAMLPSQTRRQRHLVEDGCRSVWNRRPGVRHPAGFP